MADSTAVPLDELDERISETLANIDYLGSGALTGVLELHMNEEDLDALNKMQDELLSWVLKQYGGDDEMIALPFP